MRAGVAGAAVVLAVLVGVGSAWLVAGDGNRPMSARVADVASGLRCPTCNAVSVSASNSAMAQSMREQIQRQLRAGRSPEQIRTWFADRYGGQVLLDPEPEGLGLVLWMLPAAALAGGAVVFVLTRRRPGRPTADTAADTAAGTDGVGHPSISPRRVAVAGAVVLAVGAVVPAALWDAGGGEAAASAKAPPPSGRADMSAPDWVSVASSLEHQGAYGAATEAYREALRRRPDSPAVRTRLAFVLVRDGKPQEALPLVRPLADRKGPHRVEALLVLGLAQRAASMPESTATLRKFLTLAPDHPAGRQIRRLLRDDR